MVKSIPVSYLNTERNIACLNIWRILFVQSVEVSKIQKNFNQLFHLDWDKELYRFHHSYSFYKIIKIMYRLMGFYVRIRRANPKPLILNNCGTL